MHKKALYGILFLFAAVLLTAWQWRSRESLRAEFPVMHTENSSPTASSQPSPSTEPTWTLMATGDVLTARTVNTRTLASGDFRWPFLHVAERLRSADLTFINLETPLIKDCKPRDSGMIFCGDIRHTEGLAFAGVDVINFANNHAGNQELAGVEETEKLLQTSGFTVAGRESDPQRVTVKGVRVAFLGFNEVDHQIGINLATPENVQTRTAQAREQADVVVVQFHWGNEYTRTPSSNQRRLGHLAIDAGADLVIGNHPHWWQPQERYKEGLIVYSHGNFVFDQMWSMETREGLVGEYTFEGNRLREHRFHPIRIEDYGQPHWLEGEDKERILTEFETLSGELPPFTP